MWLSDLSIKRPVFITMIFSALMVIGLIAYSRMGVDLWPDVSFPFVAVQTAYPGAGPGEVESQVSKPVEEAVGSLSGVKTVRSSSSEGLSLVMIEFQLEHPAQQAVADVQERVGAIRAGLPKDVLEPVVLRFDPNSLPIMTLAVADRSGSLTPDRLRRLVSDKIKPRLERLQGVAGTEISGGLEREIQVELSAERLKAQELSPQMVVAAIANQNLNIPAGHIDEGDRELAIRTPGDFRRVEDIGQAVIAYPSGVPLRVRDVAEVKDGFKEVRTYARLDGKGSIGVSVRKQSDTNTVDVANQVHAEVARLLKDYPNLDIIVASDFSEFIEASIADTRLDLIIGAILAALVVFVFFRSVSNTLVTVAGLPVILIGTFWLMSFLGFTVNMMTLLSLSLCIGLLIDDAIVVRENIFRHMEEGEDPKRASIRGTGEVALVVVSMTLCVVAVFLPIAFTRGIVGRFLKEFGLTVTAAVLISLFEAFTLAPMMTARFLRKSAPRRQRSTGDEDVILSEDERKRVGVEESLAPPRTSSFGQAGAKDPSTSLRVT
ncbi:MAG: efflux RND transporter permease subunit, partial [Chloroflexi bacterium]|nr:efflux RND transporter permease subunit [Chloroflexota bacterium]